MFRVNQGTSEIFIYDDIGPAWAGMIDDGIVIEALDSLKGSSNKPLLRINSGGGDVFMMTSIYNAAKRFPGGVDVAIDGLAASAASYIAMAGDTVTIASNAFLMLHKAWTVAMGNANDFRKLADTLDKLETGMVQAYSDKTGKSIEEIAAVLAEETWFNAQDAIEFGLANSIGNVVIKDATKNSMTERASNRRYAQAKQEDAMQATPYRTAAALKLKLRS